MRQASTYAGRRGNQRVVVKVAPPGVASTSNRDVLRQARIIRALTPTPVPVPEILFEDPGNPPDVPPLFVMSFIEGIGCEPLFDDSDGGPGAVVAERFRTPQRDGSLHRLEPDDLGLATPSLSPPLDEVGRASCAPGNG